MLTSTGDPSPAGVRYFTGLKTGPLHCVEWAVAHFGEPPPRNPNFAALPEADPDGDGHENLVEFAVNTSPVVVSEIPITDVRTSGGLLQKALTVRNDDPVLASLSARGRRQFHPERLQRQLPARRYRPHPRRWLRALDLHRSAAARREFAAVSPRRVSSELTASSRTAAGTFMRRSQGARRLPVAGNTAGGSPWWSSASRPTAGGAAEIRTIIPVIL